MEKLDLTKKYKTYYSAKAKPEIVEIEPAHFLSITGKGDPSKEAFTENIKALYSTAYAIKFSYKAREQDFVVAKLEAQCWFDEAKYGYPSMVEAPTKISRDNWEYRLLIRIPEFVTADEVAKGIEAAIQKNIKQAAKVELYNMHEGKCVQMLHVGPFSEEPKTLLKMQEFILEHGFEKNGHHHEIYLSDFNRTTPEKLKTILREPVK